MWRPGPAGSADAGIQVKLVSAGERIHGRKVHPSKQAGKREWENFLVLQHCTWAWEVQNVLGEGKLRV